MGSEGPLGSELRSTRCRLRGQCLQKQRLNLGDSVLLGEGLNGFSVGGERGERAGVHQWLARFDDEGLNALHVELRRDELGDFLLLREQPQSHVLGAATRLGAAATLARGGVVDGGIIEFGVQFGRHVGSLSPLRVVRARTSAQ